MYPEEGSWSEIINIQELEVGRGITTWARHSTALRPVVAVGRYNLAVCLLAVSWFGIGSGRLAAVVSVGILRYGRLA